MKKSISTIIFCLFAFLIFFAIFPTPALATVPTEISLHNTAINSYPSEEPRHWIYNYFTPSNVLLTSLSGFNYVGLKGSITMSYTGTNDPTILVYVMLDRAGNCPKTGRYLQKYAFSNPIVLASYILRASGTGQVTIPTEFTLPVKVPTKGCLTMSITGGDFNHGDPVTTTSKITFLYDTDAPPSPLSRPGSFASEICTGRDVGCVQHTLSITPDQAFAAYQRIKYHGTLQSWIGNTNSSGSKAGENTSNPIVCAPGRWNSISDYYIYKAANCPDFGAKRMVYAGPSVAVSQIPANAIKLYGTTVQGYQCKGGQALINKVFDPPLEVQAGDCMVQIQKFKFNTSQQGVIAQETQSTFVTQDIDVSLPTPSPSPSPTLSSKPGDLNADGKVDIFDYNLLVAKFGHPYTIFDYNILVGNFGK